MLSHSHSPAGGMREQAARDGDALAGADLRLPGVLCRHETDQHSGTGHHPRDGGVGVYPHGVEVPAGGIEPEAQRVAHGIGVRAGVSHLTFIHLAEKTKLACTACTCYTGPYTGQIPYMSWLILTMPLSMSMLNCAISFGKRRAGELFYSNRSAQCYTGPGHVIVTILCDYGTRHLSKFRNILEVLENRGVALR